MSTSDDESNIRNTCNVCGKKFNYVSNLKNHLLIHTGDLPYQCKTCGKSFREKGTLKGHERTHKGENSFTCDKCGKSFSRKSSLEDHIRIHTGEKPFMCKKCGKSYRQTSALRQHNCTHNGKEIYYCDKCNILFKSKDSLIVHNYVHSACDKYNVPIFPVGHLRIPDRIQKTVRPHIFCGNCNESSADLRSFREHNYSAYKVNELYSCDKCYKSFKSKDILNDHYDTHTIPVSHADNTYTISLTSQEYFSDDDQEQEIKVELEYPEDLSDPLSIKEERIKDEI